MLKLVALDEQDLDVVSAHVQDAVLKVGDMSYLRGENRFAMVMNRFVWEGRPRLFRRRHQRRRAALHFERVLGCRVAGFSLAREEEVLSLLALRFARAGDGPGGVIELTFAAGAAVQLDVEVVEARLTDLGAAWETSSRPRHEG